MKSTSCRVGVVTLLTALTLLFTGCSVSDRTPKVGPVSQDHSTTAPKPRLLVLMITDNSDHQHPDGQEGSIARGVSENEALMGRFFQKVSAGAEMDVKIFKIVGTTAPNDPFKCENINSAIRNMPVASDDAVMVYYSGHGFNIGTNNQALKARRMQDAAPAEFKNSPPTKFPFIACNTSLTNSPNLDMIATWLNRKKPRLTIVMADACNSFLTGTGPEAESFFGTAAPVVGPEPRFRSLFREATGTVLITGSEPGHYSYYWVDPNRMVGGVATIEFLRVLGDNGIPRTQPANWSDVNNAMRPVRVPVKDRNGQINTDMQRPWLLQSPPFTTALSSGSGVLNVQGPSIGIEHSIPFVVAQQVGGGTPTGPLLGTIPSSRNPSFQFNPEISRSRAIEEYQRNLDTQQIAPGTPTGPVLGPRPQPRPPPPIHQSRGTVKFSH